MFDTFFWVSSQLSESGLIYICYFCTINPYIFDLGTTSDIFLGELSLSTDFTIKFCQNSDWISPLATSPKCTGWRGACGTPVTCLVTNTRTILSREEGSGDISSITSSSQYFLVLAPWACNIFSFWLREPVSPLGAIWTRIASLTTLVWHLQ